MNLRKLSSYIELEAPRAKFARKAIVVFLIPLAELIAGASPIASDARSYSWRQRCILGARVAFLACGILASATVELVAGLTEGLLAGLRRALAGLRALPGRCRARSTAIARAVHRFYGVRPAALPRLDEPADCKGLA